MSDLAYTIVYGILLCTAVWWLVGTTNPAGES